MPLIDYIPESYKKGIKKIAELKDEEFEILQENLSSSPLVSSIFKLISNISASPGLDTDAIKEMVLSVGTLNDFLESEEMIEEVINDIVFLSSEEKLIPQEDAEKLKIRLLWLVRNRQIYYASKAKDLLFESDKRMVNCKIVTDIRPVFGFDVEKQPDAAIIIHNLHIHYESGIDNSIPHKDFFISLDSLDIGILIDTLIRAQQKEESLQLLINKIGMSTLNE